MKLIAITLLSLSLIACDSGDETSDTTAQSEQETTNTETGGDEAADEGGEGETSDDAEATSDEASGSTDEASGSTDEAATAEPTTHTVTTTLESMDFMPEDLVIAVGDTVVFEMTSNHNAVEVSKETYDERGYAPLTGGFNIGYGETGEVTFDAPGVHYYICQPHVMIDMIGTITVQ